MGLQRHNHWIAGEEYPPSSGRYFPSDDPFTCTNWAEMARGDEADVDRAVRAATDAGITWRSMGPERRGRLLTRLADLIELEGESLATLEVRENGKLLAEMRAQIRSVAAWYRYFGGLADKIEGSQIPADKPGLHCFTRYEPLGVVGLITPWNSPLLLLAHKLAAALAAGNTAVVKPSEFTSSATLAFAALCERAGIPAGVVNVVTGLGAEAGAALVAHPAVAKIGFTGSEFAGQTIYEAAARAIKPVALELGGKSPNIVFDDADLEAAVMGAVTGIFSAAGQSCIAGSRLLLHRGIHDAFVNRLVEIAGRARLGDPTDPSTNIGPIATGPQFDKVLEHIATAKAEGAICVLGGEAYRGPGCETGRFIGPTIFTGVSPAMRIAREEVFGPVLAVIPFEDEAEALKIANDTRYGLAAGVWTNDVGRALRMSELLQAGTVWINTYRLGGHMFPFGGYKRSGIGREGGVDAIKEWLQLKTVSLNTQKEHRDPYVMPEASAQVT